MAATPQIADFTNVKDTTEGSFRPRAIPDGDYVAKVTAVEDHTSKAGNKGWVFTLVIESVARASYPYYCTLDEKSLWKVRNLFVGAGMTVPAKRVKIDPNKLVGKRVGVATIQEEFNDKIKSSIDAVFPVSDVQTVTAGGKKAAAASDDADDADDAPADEDLDIEEI